MSPAPLPRTVIFALGANLGRPLAALGEAARGLSAALTEVSVSGVYRTPPEGGADQPPYLNAVLRGTGSMTAREALDLAGALERSAGRKRREAGEARVLDVDVLFVDDDIVEEPGLTVPHPRWEGRDFVVVPLLDIAPEWTDPRTGRTVAQAAAAAGWDSTLFPVVLGPGELLVGDGPS